MPRKDPEKRREYMRAWYASVKHTFGPEVRAKRRVHRRTRRRALAEWYVELKSQESDVEDPDALANLARRAGYDEVEVARVDVETGVATPEAMVDWRWGMAHLAPFVASLGPERRREAREAAEAAVEGQPPVVVPMLALSAQAASSSRRE